MSCILVNRARGLVCAVYNRQFVGPALRKISVFTLIGVEILYDSAVKYYFGIYLLLPLKD